MGHGCQKAKVSSYKIIIQGKQGFHKRLPWLVNENLLLENVNFIFFTSQHTIGLSIIWSIKEVNQVPAINLAWLWHHFHLALDWKGIEPTTFQSWAECSTARPQLLLKMSILLQYRKQKCLVCNGPKSDLSCTSVLQSFL